MFFEILLTISSLSRKMLEKSFSETKTASGYLFLRFSVFSWSSRSILLIIFMKGMWKRLNRSSALFSSSDEMSAASITYKAKSVRISIFLLRSTLSLPKSPSSSIPAVSMNMTGPKGMNSMAFLTGSVVVPFCFETSATS